VGILEAGQPNRIQGNLRSKNTNSVGVRHRTRELESGYWKHSTGWLHGGCVELNAVEVRFLGAENYNLLQKGQTLQFRESSRQPDGVILISGIAFIGQRHDLKGNVCETRDRS